MSEKKKRFKYCFVPRCKSTSISTPDKYFFFVPKNELREKWFTVCGRDAGSKNSVFVCCEDHFDLEKDAVNMMEHKFTGCSLRLKKGVLPSRFDCQPDRERLIQMLLMKKRKMEELQKSSLQDTEETLKKEDSSKCVQENTVLLVGTNLLVQSQHIQILQFKASMNAL